MMLLRFVDLRDVPVELHACSEKCQQEVVEQFKQLQTETQQQIDREYAETVRRANKNAHTVDISPERINAPSDLVSNFNPSIQFRTADWARARERNRRRNRSRKKCAIM